MKQAKSCSWQAKGWNAIQKNLDQFEQWIHGCLTNFNKASTGSCNWVRATCCINADWGGKGIESKPAEKDLVLLVD